MSYHRVKQTLKDRIEALEKENDALKTLLEIKTQGKHREYLRLYQEKQELETRLSMIKDFLHLDYKFTGKGIQ